MSDTRKMLNLQTETRLDLGECAAIVLAEEINANQLLLDDLGARREAYRRGLPVTGTVGILLLAKERRIISSLKEILDELIANGTRICRRFYEYALAVAGE